MVDLASLTEKERRNIMKLVSLKYVASRHTAGGTARSFAGGTTRTYDARAGSLDGSTGSSG